MAWALCEASCLISAVSVSAVFCVSRPSVRLILSNLYRQLQPRARAQSIGMARSAGGLVALAAETELPLD